MEARQETTHDPHEAARAFAAAEVAGSAAARDREGAWDPALFRRLGAAGLLGAGLPAALGGDDGDARATAARLVGFGEGSGDAGLALAWAQHTLGCAGSILRGGGPSLRARLLPGLARGERVGAFAHHEVDAGDAPLSLAARARRRGDRWILDGAKARVINAPVCDLVVVTARIDEPSGRPSAAAFVVERDAPGLTIGPAIVGDGLRTATIADLRLDGCEVDDEHHLGPIHPLLPAEYRALHLAPWVGLLRALVVAALDHARATTRRGRTLAAHQGARARLAELHLGQRLCALVQADAAARVDAPGPDHARAIALAQLHLSEQLRRLTHDALALPGLAASTLAGRLHRDAVALADHTLDPFDLRTALASG